MAKVYFTYTNGSTREMGEHYAKILNTLGHGTYSTKDMWAAEKPAVVIVAERTEDNLDALDIDGLRALADSRGIKYHHRAGADKLRSLLRGV